METERNFPGEFKEQLKKHFPDSYTALLEGLADPSPVSIRANPRKDRLNDSLSQVPWSTFGKYLDHRPVFTLDPHFHAGSYYVQEASSMFVEQVFRQLIDTTQSLRVLDLCGAPGGKSTHILSLLNNKSLLVSNEVIHSRVSTLTESIQKWGHCNTVITSSDASAFKKVGGYFDVVLVDAPCSGEGLFRKDTKAIQEWSVNNVAHCARRQQRILHDVWPALKPEGILIYCTCTFNPDENEHNLVDFKKRFNAQSVPLTIHSSWGISIIEHEDVIGYRFLPHQVKGEGFFLSILKKNIEDEDENQIHKSTDRYKKKSTDFSFPIELNNWISEPENMYFFGDKSEVRFIPGNLRNDLELISSNLAVREAGTPLAAIKQSKLIPFHAAALSNELNKNNFNVYDVGKSEALKFLKKENIHLTGEKGFALIRFEGSILGWVNVLGNRVNNLYPSNWRIRMSID